MVRRTNTTSKDLTKEICVEKFQEWWDVDELKDVLQFMTSKSVFDLLKNGKKDSENFLDNKQNVAELLFDSIGPRFLHTVLTEDKQEHENRTKQFWVKIFETTIKKKIVKETTVFEIFNRYGSRKKPPLEISKVSEIESTERNKGLDRNPHMLKEFATILELPIAVTEKTRASKMESTITVEALTKFPPLYDYQFSTGRYLRKFLLGEETSKRTLVTIPTGAGKTRLVVEALVEWIAEGKPSKEAKLSKSSFILWIAPTTEICEQAVDSFEEIYKHRGDPKQSLTIHRVWGKGGSMPDEVNVTKISEDFISGVIVANIQSLTKIKNKDPDLMNTLADSTGVIVVDEAHGITTKEHRSVLESMGFNWSLRATKEQPKPEFSEKGIVLIGLTATDYRGSGDNESTKLLKRMFDRIFHPIIQNYEKENLMPVPIIDCPKFAPINSEVRISGTNSFHYGGIIENYEWKITKNRLSDGSFFAKDPRQREQTVIDIPKQKETISIQFPNEGEYNIELTIKDNFEKTATTKQSIIIRPIDSRTGLSEKDIQRLLYANLMKRTILCDVYRKLVPVKDVQKLTKEEQDHFNKFKDFSRGALKKRRDNLERNQSILEIISEMMTKYDRKKILLFGIDIQHARNLQIALTAKYKINAETVTGETETEDRNKIIEEFKKEDSKVSVLCNVGVLTQGFDAPKVDCVVVARPTHSNSLYTQMIGRGMRGKKSGGTVDVILVDMNDQWVIKDTEGKELENKNGFELFKDFWKDISQYKKADSGMDEIEIKWSCAKCKKLAIGWVEIEKEFHPTGDITDYITMHASGIFSRPENCEDCRTEFNIPENSKTIEEIAEQKRQIKLEQKNQDKKIKSESLIEIYRRLKKEFGHPATKSYLYSNPLVDDETKEIIEKYYGNYDNFVKEQGDIIVGNPILTTKLLDEYFDEFAEHHIVPSRYMMDRFGHYKLVDYEECFGSFEKFQKAINPTLEKIQTIKEEHTIQELEKDYTSIKESISHAPGYRDLLRSKLGIEHYLKKFRTISAAIKFFEDVESPEYIKRIIKENYWEIRKKLGQAVSYFQFLKHGQFGSKINEYWKNYDDFLQWVGEKDSPITKSQSDLETLREKFLADKVNAYKKDAKQTLERIYNDDEFWYKEYFTSTHMLLKDMNKKIPGVDIEKQYDKVVHEQSNPEKKKSKKKSHPKKSGTITIADTLTKKDMTKIMAGIKAEKQANKEIIKHTNSYSGSYTKKKKEPKTKQDSELKKIRGRLARKEITKAEYEKLKLKILKKKFQTTKNSKQQPKTTNKHLHTQGKICPKCGSKTKKYGTNISCTNPKCNWFKN